MRLQQVQNKDKIKIMATKCKAKKTDCNFTIIANKKTIALFNR